MIIYMIPKHVPLHIQQAVVECLLHIQQHWIHGRHRRRGVDPALLEMESVGTQTEHMLKETSEGVSSVSAWRIGMVSLVSH